MLKSLRRITGKCMRKIIVSKRVSFNAAHRLHAKSLSDAENTKVFGKCNNPNGHGHNYELDLELYGEIDPVTGMVVNLTEVKQIVEREIIERFDHKHLNADCPEFADLVPTAENIAVVIWERLAKTKLKPYLHAVNLYETERNRVRYQPH